MSHMLRFLFSILYMSPALFLSAQVSYRLQYKDSSKAMISVSIALSSPILKANFVMPRSIPGGYQIYAYDKYIENIYAINTDGEKQVMVKDGNDAPRWYCSDTTKKITQIEYEVNLDKMERHVLPGDASIIRPGFAGLLNYSIFGWIDGIEKEPVQCSIETFDQWPVFSTIQPSATPEKGKL